jgi:hypothetical protein
VTTIVLVHGRRQQHKDPVSLEREWETALLRGLAAAGAPQPPPPETMLFPYYGDLYEDYALAIRQPSTVAEKRDQIEFERIVAAQVARKMAKRRKRPLPRRKGEAVAAGWYDPLLELLDRVPGFSRGFVRLVMRDVYDYVSNKNGLRQKTMQRVAGTLERSQQGPVIVIAHSLGSIVTYDILNSTPQLRVDLYITIGSPLGVDQAVTGRLLPDRSGLRGVPAGVRQWANFADPDDFVALDETLADDFKRGGHSFVRDVRDRNPRGQNKSPHSSDSYLSQPKLGQVVGAAL